MFRTDRPILLALGWGAAATWWVGLVLGGLTAVAAQVGPAPRVNLGQLLRPAAALLASIAVCSIVLGLVGYGLGRADVIGLSGMIAMDVPATSHDRFMANAWAHTAAYGAGALGAMTLCGWIVAQRLKGRQSGVKLRAPHARSA